MATKETQIKRYEFPVGIENNVHAFTPKTGDYVQFGHDPVRFGTLNLNLVRNKKVNKGAYTVHPRPSLGAQIFEISKYTAAQSFFTWLFADSGTGGIASYQLSSVRDISSDTRIYVNNSLELTFPTSGTFGHITSYYSPTTGAQYAVFANGVDRPYYMDTSLVTTQIADTDCPSGLGTSPFCVYLDGALFIAKGNAIYNSEFGNITSWPGYVRVKEQYPEPIVALAKHRNSIVAFSMNSIEFFYNAGLSGTSPLARQESYAIQLGSKFFGFGTFASSPYAQIEDTLFFMGGGVNEWNVYIIDNFKPVMISTPFISSVLNFYGSQIANGNAFRLTALNYGGKKLFFITLINLDGNTYDLGQSGTFPTLVYDLLENKWDCWTARFPSTNQKSFNFGELGTGRYCHPFPFIFDNTSQYALYFGQSAAASSNIWGVYPVISSIGDTVSPFGSGTDNGRYFFDYNDVDAFVDFCIRTPILDFDSQVQKHLKKVYLLDVINRTDSDGNVPDVISMYVFNQFEKDGSVGTYPASIDMKSYKDSIGTNLSTSRKFVIELQWSGNYIASFGGLELHYIEGEQ